MNHDDERDFEEEAFNAQLLTEEREEFFTLEKRVPGATLIPDGCDGSDVSWHGSRPECQGMCNPAIKVDLLTASYEDYDANSAENLPEVTGDYMIVLVGMSGFLIKADIVITARDQDHAEALAEGIATACGGATVDSVYEVG
jgi:hypothetical protein